MKCLEKSVLGVFVHAFIACSDGASAITSFVFLVQLLQLHDPNRTLGVNWAYRFIKRLSEKYEYKHKLS